MSTTRRNIRARAVSAGAAVWFMGCPPPWSADRDMRAVSAGPGTGERRPSRPGRVPTPAERVDPQTEQPGRPVWPRTTPREPPDVDWTPALPHTAGELPRT